MAEQKYPEPNNCPRVPSNWEPNGLSKGKQKGAVRPTKDAYQGSRGGKRG